MTLGTVCADCNGTGWAPTVTVERETPTERHRLCGCVQARRTHQRLAAAGIPAIYHGRTFDTYRAYNDTLSDALGIARAFTDRYPIQLTDYPLGLMFIGPAGVGKTHLVAALLTAIIQRTGIKGVFYKTRDLLRVLRASYNPEIRTTETQILDPILTCDLLVLDDLGAERTTEWVDDVMNSIVDTRYSEGRPLLVTSNFPDLDDPENVSGLQYRVGFRMHSRLREMCRRVDLDGGDYRDTDGSAAQLLQAWKKRRGTPPARDLRRGPRPTPKDGAGDLKWPGGRGGNS